MKKNKKKLFWKFYFPILTIISLGAIITPMFFLSKKLKQYNFQNANNYFKLQINDYQNTFSDSEIEKLKTKIEKELPYGPEIHFLKSINFDFNSQVLANKEGAYIANTQEIFIKTKKFSFLNSEEKIEKIFQIIFHEYFHHFESTYISSVVDGVSFNLNQKKFNTNFVNDFLKSLNINSKYQNFSGKKEVLNQKDFFYKKDYYQFWKKINCQNIELENSSFDLNSKNNPLFFEENFSQKELEYYFSFEENIAREALKHFYLNNFVFKNYANNDFLKEWSLNSLIKEKNGKWIIDKTYNPNNAFGDFELENLDDAKQKIYIENKIEKFYNSFLKIMNYGSNISSIFIEDNTNLNDIKENNRNFWKIKFSGYAKEKYTHLIFKDKKNQYIKIPLKWSESFNFNGKQNFNSSFHDLKPKNQYFSYVSEIYLNLENINLEFYPYFYDEKDSKNFDITKLKKVIINNEINLDLKEISNFRSYHKNLNTKINFTITKNKMFIKK